MSLIHFKSVLYCSDEDPVNFAENLLKPDQSKAWLSSSGTEESIICELKFEKPSLISSVHIGNDGSAFVELLVSRSSPENDEWTVLLPPTLLMTPNESRTDRNRNLTKVFKSNELNVTCLNEKWDRLKVICEQKFAVSKQFGLRFIKLYSTVDNYDEVFKRKSKNKKTERNKSNIMRDVMFVLSGFENPLRAQLRNKAMSMGAVYNEDWDERCTHLICAFPNTPKFKQVQQSGDGIIVDRKWILDCYRRNILLPEKDYELKESSDDSEPNKKIPKRKSTSETDKQVNGEEESSTTKASPKKKSITRKEEEANRQKLIEIPDFFHGIHFYVSYGDYDDETLLAITRVILAYDGTLEGQITPKVKYVITNRMWNQDFSKIAKSNPDISFVNLDWLQDCHDANQFAPIQEYLVVPY